MALDPLLVPHFVLCLPKPGKTGRIATERAFSIKWKYDGVGGTDSLDKVASGWIICDDMMGMNSLPKTVTRQRRDCDLNPGPSAPESSTLTTQLPSHPPSL